MPTAHVPVCGREGLSPVGSSEKLMSLGGGGGHSLAHTEVPPLLMFAPWGVMHSRALLGYVTTFQVPTRVRRAGRRHQEVPWALRSPEPS